jgi:hypothetical protein
LDADRTALNVDFVHYCRGDVVKFEKEFKGFQRNVREAEVIAEEGVITGMREYWIRGERAHRLGWQVVQIASSVSSPDESSFYFCRFGVEDVAGSLVEDDCQALIAHACD